MRFFSFFSKSKAKAYDPFQGVSEGPTKEYLKNVVNGASRLILYSLKESAPTLVKGDYIPLLSKAKLLVSPFFIGYLAGVRAAISEELTRRMPKSAMAEVQSALAFVVVDAIFCGFTKNPSWYFKPAHRAELLMHQKKTVEFQDDPNYQQSFHKGYLDMAAYIKMPNERFPKSQQGKIVMAKLIPGAV